MNELAKHIEVLLLENDCVIVPGLGGFIAHNCPAEFKESANIFCPPVRTIGFNPQLIMNDGLLVQSYMQTYNTDFPDATRKIEKIVSHIKDELYKEGQVEIDNIGTLYYNMMGTYGFEPYQNNFHSPYLYGLGSFTISTLAEIRKERDKKSERRIVVETKPRVKVSEKLYERKERKIIRKVAENVIGIAASIILFFLLSVPVENTYLDNASYASLGAETMLDAVRNKSVVVSPRSVEQKQVTKNNVNTLKPVAVKTVMVPAKETKAATKAEAKAIPAEKPAVKPATAKSSSNSATQVAKNDNTGSFVIVASLPTMKDAEKELAKYKEQGYNEASILASGERFRIALYRYSDKTQAYSKVNELRAEEQFKNAWVLNKSK